MKASSKAALRWSAPRVAARPFGVYDAVCVAACLVAALLLATGPLGRVIWAADVVNLFRPYAVLASALVLAACLLARRPALVVAAALLTAAEVLLVSAPVFAADPLEPVQGGSRVIKVITFNCFPSNPHASAVAAWLRAAKPDVLALEELPDGWERELATLKDVLPYRASQTQSIADGTDIFSRYPIAAANVYRPARDLRAVVQASIPIDGVGLQVFALHPNTLRTAAEWRYRNEALELGAQWIRQTKGRAPTLVLGDWNTPPWSPYFHSFLRIAGIRVADPLVWPPMTRVLAVPGGWRLGSDIDHIAATRGLRVLDCATGPQMGSDHAPQICRLELPAR